MRLYTVYYISVKLLYMFRVVPPPIIRSTCNCNYSIWHWSDRTCYLPLSWRSRNHRSDSSTIAEGSKYGLTSARCCNYSYMCSWWWVEVPPETCREVLQKYNKVYIVVSCCTIIDIDDDEVHGAVPILRKNGRSFGIKQHSKDLSFISINYTEHKHTL
jgi:hypothetical protein